jgi:hypothetical protein
VTERTRALIAAIRFFIVSFCPFNALNKCIINCGATMRGKSFGSHKTHTSNIFHEASHHGTGDAIPAKSGPVAGFKATLTHCGYFHCQFP